MALQGQPSQAFFGVYDGHGGVEAAQFAASQLHMNVLASADIAADASDTFSFPYSLSCYTCPLRCAHLLAVSKYVCVPRCDWHLTCFAVFIAPIQPCKALCKGFEATDAAFLVKAEREVRRTLLFEFHRGEILLPNC